MLLLRKALAKRSNGSSSTAPDRDSLCAPRAVIVVCVIVCVHPEHPEAGHSLAQRRRFVCVR